MKAFCLLILIFALPLLANAQVVVKDTDLNEAVEMFELYAFKKPFSTKEVYFVNFGQDKFRLHFYDHKSQAIFDDKGEKFEKGEWLKLMNYLRAQGWKKTDERKESLGNNEGRVVQFERVIQDD